MEKEEKQQENHPSLLSHGHNRNPNTPNNNPKYQLESSPRLKRDEWSEGAVSSLLEAYEAKWILRNRAKLKGQDWEDVARHVSSRANSTKSPKTQTQCKNKIESMKKRYRSESAATDASSWPLFPRLDLLLRGSGTAPPRPPPPPALTSLPPPPQPPLPLNPPTVLFQQPLPSTVPAQQQHPPPPSPPPPLGIAPNSDGSNGNDQEEEEDGEQMNQGLDRNGEDQVEVETDSSTPAAIYSDKGENNNNKLKSKSGSSLKKRRRLELKKRKRREMEWEIGESIRWLGEAMVRTERARMETMKEVERMRAEADARRGEFDLKRTQIIANTQLEIARLFAAGVSKTLDSSLRIGRN